MPDGEVPEHPLELAAGLIGARAGGKTLQVVKIAGVIARGGEAAGIGQAALLEEAKDVGAARGLGEGGEEPLVRIGGVGAGDGRLVEVLDDGGAEGGDRLRIDAGGGVALE